MVLKLSLKPNEKAYIGSAVISNAHSVSVEILVHNDVTVLRQKDIMLPENADTPCKLIYFTVQLMYLDPKNADLSMKHFFERAREVLDAAPSTMIYLFEIQRCIVEGDYYSALKKCKKLIAYEEELLNDHSIRSLPEGREGNSIRPQGSGTNS